MGAPDPNDGTERKAEQRLKARMLLLRIPKLPMNGC